MTYNTLLFFLLFPLTLVLIQEKASADSQRKDSDPELRAFLTGLEEKVSGVKSLQTDFVQEKNLAVFDRPLVLKGTIYMEKPDLFAWHVREPMRYSMVIKGETVRQWDADTGKVQKTSLSKNPAMGTIIKQMEHWFSGAYTSLLDEYRVTITRQEEVTLQFVPLEGALAYGLIEGVTIRFRDDNRYIRQIQIQEKGGDSTVLTFFDTLLDTPIDSAAWEVKPRDQ